MVGHQDDPGAFGGRRLLRGVPERLVRPRPLARPRAPGDLPREIIENRNVAAAILGGAMILGVCVIIAAAMLG